MPGIFELRKNADELFYFHFVDTAGELLMLSGDYDDKAEAEQAIKDVKVGTLTANQIAAGKVPAGDTFFVIKDAAGDIIAKSVLFNSRMLFDSALHRVKDNTCVAEIVDLT